MKALGCGNKGMYSFSTSEWYEMKRATGLVRTVGERLYSLEKMVAEEKGRGRGRGREKERRKGDMQDKGKKRVRRVR